MQGTGGDELFGGYPWRYYRVFKSLSQNEFFESYYDFWQRLVPDGEREQLFTPAVRKNVDFRDPRDTFERVFTFNQNIKTINDLHEGQLLPGIVNNITNFGCFVDVGIKESGLIHVSNLSDSFVKDVNEHVSLHQQIIVKVLEVDVPRKRIQLKLHT